jgi:hypothetical protein
VRLRTAFMLIKTSRQSFPARRRTRTAPRKNMTHAWTELFRNEGPFAWAAWHPRPRNRVYMISLLRQDTRCKWFHQVNEYFLLFPNTDTQGTYRDVHRSQHKVCNDGTSCRNGLLNLGRENKQYCFVALTTKDLADGALRNLHGAAILGRPIMVEPRRPGLSRREANNRIAESTSNHKFHVDTALQRQKRTDAVDSWGYEATRLLVLDLPVLTSYYGFDRKIRELFQGFNV